MRDFFQALNTLGEPQRPDIIEKDYHLHRLLFRISQDGFLSRNLAFKGGTCLIKAYLDYYRFSEDLDFTWVSDDIWKNKNSTAIDRLCSNNITKIVSRFKYLTDELGLSFSGEKTGPDVHISSGGKMVYFTIAYRSEILNVDSSIKIEVNLVEKLLFPLQKRKVRTYLEVIDSPELEFLYNDFWKEYSRDVSMLCYDPKEIYIEKCRAFLTRRNYKHRDILDIISISRKYGYSVSAFRKDILDKTLFSLKRYQRYRENISSTTSASLDSSDTDEIKLLLRPMTGDVSNEISSVYKELNGIREELLTRV